MESEKIERKMKTLLENIFSYKIAIFTFVKRFS
jgi:hypothetical protein